MTPPRTSARQPDHEGPARTPRAGPSPSPQSRSQRDAKLLILDDVQQQFPLVNTHDSRQMLTEAFQSEVENACRELLAEIAALNEKARANGNRINVKKYAEMNGRYQEVLSRSEEYTRVLGLSQGRAGAALELAMDSVMDLATRLDIGGKK